MIKKLISVLFCFICFSTLLFAGCVIDPATYYFNYDELLLDVDKVELINYENEKSKEIKVEKDTVLIFEVSKAQILDTLENSKVNSFLYDLSTITFHLDSYSADSPSGIGIRLNLKNGNFLIISCAIYSFVAEFNENSDFIRHIARFADKPKYERLLDEYFST